MCFKTFLRRNIFIEPLTFKKMNLSFVWIAIFGALALLYVFSKITNKGQNAWSYIVVGLLLFLLITFVYIGSFPQVTLSSPSGIIQFGKLYVSWVGSIFTNFKTITGSAIQLDWLGKNLSQGVAPSTNRSQTFIKQ